MRFRLTPAILTAVLCLCWSLLLPTLPAVAGERVTLQLRWDHQFQFAGYYAALWQGYYADAGLEVELRSAFGPGEARRFAVTEVAEGRAEFGIGAADILIGRSEGVPLVVLATLMQQSDAAFFGRAEYRFDEPADLSRLRLLLRSGGPLRLELQALLHHAGITLGPTPAPAGEYGMGPLLRGEAEAVSGSMFDLPYLGQQAGLRLQELRPGSFGVHFCGDSLFTREELLRKHPDLAARFREASLRGWDYALHHPVEMADRIARELPRTLPLAEPQGFNRYQIAVVEELSGHSLVRPGRIDPQVWDEMAEALLAAGLIRQRPSLDRLLFDPAIWFFPWWQRHQQQLVAGGLLALGAVVLLLTWVLTLRRTARRVRGDILRLESRYRRLYQSNLVAISDEDFTGILEELERLRQAGVTDLDVHLRANPEDLRRLAGRIRVNNVNPATLELFGAQSLEQLNAAVDTVFPPESADALRASMVALWERRAYFSAETCYRGLGGREIHAIISYPVPRSAEDARSVPVSLIEISRRKQAERELEQSRQRYRNLFRTAAIAIVEEDLTGLREALRELREQGVTDLAAHFAAHPELVPALLDRIRLIDANAAALRLLGAPDVGALRSRSARIFVHDTTQRFKDMLFGLWRGERSFTAEAPGLTLKNEPVYVRLSVTFPERDEDWQYVSFCLVDLTVSRQREVQLRQLSHAVEQTSAMVVITDTEGCIEYVNPAFEQTTGYSRDEAVGRRANLLKSGFTPDQVYRELWQTIGAGEVWRGECYNRKKNGEYYWEYATISPLKNERGDVTHYVSVKEDISRLKEQETQLMLQAHFDGLTGLPNRALALDRLEHALDKARREGRRMVALMFVDLDNFKDVNDSLGHDAGDALLVEAAARIKYAVRAADTVGRFGGDEFVVVLEEMPDSAAVEAVAHKINQAFRSEFSIHGQAVVTTSSIGIALMPDNGTTVQELLKAADAAMYKAKAAGRNTFHFFTLSMNLEASERLQLEGKLRHALTRQDLFLEYQPLMNLADGCCVGAEALLRWRDPELGLVAPARFIPVAEGIGCIGEIGAWVLRQACRQGREWLDRWGEPLQMAVNVSPRQIHSGDILPAVEQALAESGLPANCLVIELTEGLLIQDHRSILDCLEQLKRFGVQLSVDDFGTGFSSLGYLQRFPFDILKIDRAFVGQLESSADSATLVRAIIAMAQGLGLSVVGEGVESVAQADYLRQLGCGTVQGFHFSRPLSAAAFADFLAAPARLT